jgi:RecA/RadA recombinase
MDLKEFDTIYGEKGKNFAFPVSTIVPGRKLLDSGLLTFNLVHGTGGIYTGGMIRIMGAPGMGKSSLCYRIMASGLAQGMSVLSIDSEASFNPAIFADTIDMYGLDGDAVLEEGSKYPIRIVPPSNLREVTKGNKRPFFTIQEMMPLVEQWMLSEDISPNGAVVVIDSLDFIANDDQIEKGVESAGVAVVARMLKNWMRRIVGTIRGTGSLLIIVSQESSQIGTQSYDPVTFFGGNAVRFFSSMDLRLKDIGQEKVKDELVGRKVQATITKSKQGKPWRRFEYVIRSDVGPDNYAAAIDAGKAYGLIENPKNSSWYTVPLADGTKYKFQGYDSVRNMLIEHPENYEYLYKAIWDEANRTKIDNLSIAVDPVEDDANFTENIGISDTSPDV